jgi:hypothetical protein
VKLLRGHALAPREIGDEPGVEVARAPAHRHAGGGREGHRGVDALAVADGGDARAIAEMSDDQPRRQPAGLAAERAGEVGVGEPVEAVAPDPLRLVLPRNGQEPAHARQITVERGVEARDLRQTGESARAGLDQRDPGGEMLGIEGADAPQLIQEFGRDLGGREEARAPVHDAVPDRLDDEAPGRERVDHEGKRSGMVRRRDLPTLTAVEGQGRVRAPDPLDLPAQAAPGGLAWRERRELQARRARVYGQDRGHGEPWYPRPRRPVKAVAGPAGLRCPATRRCAPMP